MRRFAPWITFALVLAHEPADAQKKPSLRIFAMPRAGVVPLTVQLLATVRGGNDRDPKLYCVDAVWDFEDGQVADRQDCPPFEDGGTIRRSYSAMHTFENTGSYRVSLSLKQGNATVLRSEVKVHAYPPSGIRLDE